LRLVPPVLYQLLLGFTAYAPEGEELPVPGYGIEFDSWYNSERLDPSSNHIALIKDRASNHLKSVDDGRTEDYQWHQVKIEVGDSSVAVYVDGGLVFTWSGTIDRTHGGMGFAAATGAYTNWHLIDDVKITTLPTGPIKPVEAQVVERQPLWSYRTGGELESVAISSDGSYIAAGGRDYRVYLFSRSSGTPHSTLVDEIIEKLRDAVDKASDIKDLIDRAEDLIGATITQEDVSAVGKLVSDLNLPAAAHSAFSYFSISAPGATAVGTTLTFIVIKAAVGCEVTAVSPDGKSYPMAKVSGTEIYAVTLENVATGIWTIKIENYTLQEDGKGLVFVLATRPENVIKNLEITQARSQFPLALVLVIPLGVIAVVGTILVVVLKKRR
jgi:WD40 repeat protein